MKGFNVRRIKLFAISLLSVMFIFCISGAFNVQSLVFAENLTRASTDFVLPKTKLEYFDLVSPIDVYQDEQITAIVQSQKLILYNNGEFSEINSIFSDLKQVNRLTQDLLVVSDYGSLFSLNLNDPTQKQMITYSNNQNEEPVGATFFDLNRTHLVTSYSTRIFVYDLIDGNVYNRQAIDNASLNPVAINERGDIFFISNNGNLMQSSVNNTKSVTIILPSVSISYMIADNDYVYFIENKQIFRYAIGDGTLTQLTVIADENYDLGKLDSPVSIDFYNNNLLISDNSINAIQEFKINGTNLLFSGFAITENKTAYNRIKKDATHIEKYGDTIAVLDSKKLSLITIDFADQYNTENFNNLLRSSENSPLDISAQYFALGNDTLIYSTSDRSKVLFFDYVTSDTPVQVGALEGNFLIDGICYQSGFYYLLTHTNSHSVVYSIPELSADEINATEILRIPTNDLKFINVDVFDNVYLANNYTVYKYVMTNGVYDGNSKETLLSTSGIKKIATDLSAGLFVLDVNGLNYYDTSINALTQLPIDTEGHVVKSFAMDFITKEVYLLFDNEEFISVTTELPNVVLSSITATNDEFVTTAITAKLNELKIYKATENANVYKVTRVREEFNFEQLVENRNEYVLVCPITVTTTFTSTTFFVLVGQDETVIINSADAIDVTPTFDDCIDVAYTTTSVCMYYIPLITKDGGYSLAYGEARLSKGTRIYPQNCFTYLEREYYYASADVDGTTYYGYIPKVFTAEILSQNFKWDEYVLERVNATDLYLELSLETAFLELEDNASVRVLSTHGNVAYVAIQGETGFITGYISVKDIKNLPSLAIRNALIVLAVAASVCGTTTYFVLKKKED